MPELTSRDRDILEALTRRVRVFSIAQIVRTWWRDSKKGAETAERRLRVLAAQDLLLIQRVLAHPEIDLPAPVVSWSPGDPHPDLGAAAYQLQKRWVHPPAMTTCVSATKTAANQFGGHCSRPPREIERTHDIHMAAVFLKYREQSPELLRHWIFEETLKQERKREKFEKLPDVILRFPPGQERIIDFGGAYSKLKLEAFHEYCFERALPYEIW